MSNTQNITKIDNKIEYLLKENPPLDISSCVREPVMCGESASELIHKVIIQEITFMKSRCTKDPEIYDYHMLVPESISYDDEKQIIEANYNKIREILGWKKISLGKY